ncbi:MAG: archease [Desulfobacteraceae bacterium]|jgi:SHS2 domain-containing protein|nr:archease [Desulfobacteraceae bacterium]
MSYELIDHTADIGICITEASIKGLFEISALAMFEQIADTTNLVGSHTKEIHVKGIDRTDLLINWLRELLCCWTIDNCLVREITIITINNNHLSANITYDEFELKTHEILKDIKAVTYHGASVEEVDNGWQATIIFDV